MPLFFFRCGTRRPFPRRRRASLSPAAFLNSLNSRTQVAVAGLLRRPSPPVDPRDRFLGVPSSSSPPHRVQGAAGARRRCLCLRRRSSGSENSPPPPPSFHSSPSFPLPSQSHPGEPLSPQCLDLPPRNAGARNRSPPTVVFRSGSVRFRNQSESSDSETARCNTLSPRAIRFCHGTRAGPVAVRVRA